MAELPSIDPDAISTRAELAQQLTELRQIAGYTVRDLATRLGIPAATLGGYLTGRHLPSASQLMTFTALLRECGVTQPDDVWRWVAALTRARATSDGRTGRREVPYRGLEPFRVTDADWFFGRDDLTRVLIGHLEQIRTAQAPPSLIVPLVGASGSGKSSLLSAGLIPAVAAGALGQARTALAMTPGTDPLGALTRLLGGGPSPAVVIVDQFEELFTLSADADARERFLAALEQFDPRRTSVVIGMRADFYPAAMTEPRLVPALQNNQVLVTPMSVGELRAAIIEPARRAGLTVEPALVDAVLADLAPSGIRDRAHDPGSLPLMSHALLSTWARSRRSELTVETYRASGGIAGAVQQTAEELYTQLDAEDQAISRRLFLRLVNLGDDAALTRRRLDRAEIAELTRSGNIDQLVDTYVARRLLTTDQNVVQISHEALLTAWPRLNDWIDIDREGLRLHRQLTEAANLWEQAGRDPALVLVGTRLAALADWADDVDHASDLNHVEQQYLATSIAADDARREAEHRQNRRLKRLLTLVAALAVAAVLLAGFAWRSQVTATNQRTRATQARDQALSRQVAGEVVDLESKDPALAAQLALAGYAVSPTAEARSAVLGATGDTTPTRLVASTGPLQSVALAPSTHLLAAAGADGLVHLWRSSGVVPAPLPSLHPAKAGTIFAVALSPDGTTLAAAGAARSVELWNVADPAHARRLTPLSGFANTVFALAFSADGTVLAAGSADGTVCRWTMSATSPPVEGPPIGPFGSFVQALAFSPTGSLAVGTATGALSIYAAGESPHPTLQNRSDVGRGHPVLSIAFAPQGGIVATGSTDHALRVWRVGAHGAPVLLHQEQDFASWVNSVAFDPSGTRVIGASSDDSVRVYDVASGAALADLPHAEPVTSVTVDTIRRRLVTVGNDGTVRLWPMTARSMSGPSDSVFSLGYAKNGLLAVGPGAADGHVELWGGRAQPKLLSTAIRAMVSGDALDGASAISPNGRLVAAGSSGGRVSLWDVSTPTSPRYLGLLPGTETAAKPTVEGVAFSSDSGLLAAGGDDGKVRVWDVSQPDHPQVTGVLSKPTNYVFSVAFSHDGRYLAAASADNKAYVWTMTRKRPTRLVATMRGFSSYAYAVAFSPNADILAIGSADASARLFEVTAHGATPYGRRLVGATDTIYAMAFSPDGQTVAAASQDGAVHLWNVGSSALTASLTVGSGVDSVAFSPDGRTIVGSGSDHKIHAWSSMISLARKAICASGGTAITRTEWLRYVPGAPYDPPCR